MLTYDLTQEERPDHNTQDNLPPDQMGKGYGKQPACKPKSAAQTSGCTTTPVTIFHFSPPKQL
jgi:hypothetical protein